MSMEISSRYPIEAKVTHGENSNAQYRVHNKYFNHQPKPKKTPKSKRTVVTVGIDLKNESGAAACLVCQDKGYFMELVLTKRGNAKRYAYRECACSTG